MKLRLIHGGGEIKRIDPQIKKAFKLLDGHNLGEVRQDGDLLDKICSLGFDYESSSGATFLGNTQVIKCGLVTRMPPPIKYRIPTLIYDYDTRPLHPKNWDWVHVLLIQPLIKPVHSEEHWIEMANIEKRIKGTDFHEDNFGIYKGEVKLLDW